MHLCLDVRASSSAAFSPMRMRRGASCWWTALTRPLPVNKSRRLDPALVALPAATQAQTRFCKLALHHSL